MENHFDVIVIGVGSMGSAACYELADRGCLVLGIDQFEGPHQWGSHTGHSRLIRQSYFEHSSYVPLLQEAYIGWEELESETGINLFHRTGIAYFGKPAHPILEGVRRSAKAYGLSVEPIDADQVIKDFPNFRFPENTVGLWEENAGYLLVGKAIETYQERMIKLGGKFYQSRVLKWHRVGHGFEVFTAGRTFHSDKLIISAGAWTKQLIVAAASKLAVCIKTIGWFDLHPLRSEKVENYPCWLYASGEGAFYGMPMVENPDGNRRLKVAYHSIGIPFDPDQEDRTAPSADVKVLRGFVDAHLPLANKLIDAKTCLYTFSPDEHFYVDFVPGYDDAAVACGFSGHGFKFAPVIGRILADLVLEGATSLPADFLRFERE